MNTFCFKDGVDALGGGDAVKDTEYPDAVLPSGLQAAQLDYASGGLDEISVLFTIRGEIFQVIAEILSLRRKVRNYRLFLVRRYRV